MARLVTPCSAASVESSSIQLSMGGSAPSALVAMWMVTSCGELRSGPVSMARPAAGAVP